MTPQEQVQEAIQDLSTKLISAHPEMPILLRKIHQQLKADPDIVTLLTEEEIGIIVNGLSKQTQTAISTSISSGKKGKSIKSIGLADLWGWVPATKLTKSIHLSLQILLCGAFQSIQTITWLPRPDNQI